MPLLERLKFLCIFSSNMDEFFEVRVAGLKEQIRANSSQRSPDGMTPRQQYRAVSETAHTLVARQYELFNEDIIPALAEQDIHSPAARSGTKPRRRGSATISSAN
jgi:polyphosphate kinase